MNAISTRGKTSTPHRDPADPPRRRAHTRQGHGTSANDRPPILSRISRETGEPRVWVCAHADRRTCHALIAEHIPPNRTGLSTDEWQSDDGSHAAHATVGHGTRAWARDDDRNGRREVHGHSCEGAGTALRTSLRTFRGVHKPYWHLYVATYEAMVNTTRVTPHLIHRMCIGDPSAHPGYT
jgi:transposase-like protein